MKVLKFFVPVFLLLFLLFNALSNFSKVQAVFLQLDPLPLLLAFIIMLFIYPEGAFGWYMILKKADLKISFKKALRIWIISNASRYIPGSIWQYIGRVELSKKVGIAREATVSSVLLEIFLVLISGIFVSLLAFPFIKLEFLDSSKWIYFLPIPLFILHPKLSSKILVFLGKVLKKGDFNPKLTLSFKDTVSIFPVFLLNFLLNGFALFFVIVSLTHNFEILNLIKSTGFYSLSWVLGYISLISPGGIGVSELSLAGLYGFEMDFAKASLVALLYRLMLTVAEILIFCLALKIK